MTGIRYLAAATALGLATAAPGQDARLRVEQVGAPGETATAPVDQIGPASRRVDSPAPPPSASGPLQQLSTEADSERSPPQLSTRPEGRGGPTQLYTGGRTAQPAEPLSRPSQGRTGAVTRVEGEDRCDPAAATAQAGRCERVIETRSAEFTRPDSIVLSPEQRILVQQRLREAPAGPRMGAKRLAENGDPDSEDSQSIASIVLRSPTQPREEEAAGEEDATAAEAAAIVNAIINAANGPRS
jgi:hypothetical protein